MSRLYIRVMTGFYSHRKTVRLRGKLGMDALWLPPRIWAYCAENQPDGNLSGYEPSEIAMLAGYLGDATSMLQALKDCGFIDENGFVHDWEEHNGYHEKFSQRAKTAASARWSKKQEKESGNRKVESGDKQCLEHASSIKVEKPISNDSRFKALWISEFKAHFKSDYMFQGAKDGAACKALIATGKTPTELLEFIKKTWQYQFRFAPFLQQQSITIAGFRSKWNEFQEAIQRIESKTYGANGQVTSLNPAADRRNAGTIGHTDYGAAAERKLARQAAAYGNGVVAGETGSKDEPPPVS